MVPPEPGGQPIPRIVHRLWLGANAVPRIFEQYAERWRVHHPAWEMRLWRDDDLPGLGCQDLLDGTTGFKRRYDMLRLEIVRQHGGVIVDMDVEPIRPLDPLLFGVGAFVGRTGDKHIGNQVLGGYPHHPFFELAVQRLRARPDRPRNSSEAAGKSFLKQALELYPQSITVFPSRTFYYEPSFEPPRRPDEFPDVYAVHHQLESYASGADEEIVHRSLERFLRRFERAMRLLHAATERGDIDRLQPDLDEAERRLKRAMSRHDQGQRARLRAAIAEVEQAAVRLAENDRQWRLRLEDVEHRLSRALEMMNSRHQPGLRDRVRNLVGRWRA